jgi:hypothetical protein
MRITGLNAPEGRNIGNTKLPPQYFSPRGAQLEYYVNNLQVITPLWG